MKRTACAAGLAIFAAAMPVHPQDCTGKPRLSINPRTLRATIAFPGDIPRTIHDGDPVTLDLGGTAFPARAHVFSFGDANSIELETATPIDNSTASGFTSGEASIRTASGTMLDLCPLTPLNYSMHVGPSVGMDSDGAIRFQLRKALLRTITVRSNPNLIPAMRNLQEELSVSIDTTDRQPVGTMFVDDNRITGAIRSPEYSARRAFNRVRVGVEGEFARAIHNEDRHRDFTVAVEGWLPFLRPINLLSAGRTVTLPLHFRISGGHRDQNVEGKRSRGAVLAGDLAYHFYVFDHYAVDLSAALVYADVSDRPPSTPRTQHSYRAQVSYKQDALSRFSVLASFENGHAGPVFTRLRQYFLGVGADMLVQAAK